MEQVIDKMPDQKRITLDQVKDAVWYQRLSGVFTYDQGCDIFEFMLPATAALLKEST